MCISKLLIKTVSPLPKFINEKKFLFVAPHPDDIEIGAGATVARLCAENKEVYFVIATNGKLGSLEHMESEKIIQMRQKEVMASAKILGVKEVVFLPFDDGGSYTIEDMSLELAKIYAKIKPDIVFAPDPHLETECHLDHIKTGYAAANAVITASVPEALHIFGLTPIKIKALAFYYTDKPNYYFSTKNYVKKQKAAFAQYKSQFSGDINDMKSEFGSLYIYLLFKNKLNGIKKFKRGAEAFRVLSSLMYHCCTEKL